MQTITGTITNAGQASAPSGNYQVRYQDVVITDQAGIEHVGRIGSKQGYQSGTPIVVTVEVKPDNQNQGGTYNYFRKFNPQQQGPQNTPQGHQNTPQNDKPDWNAISQGKVRHGVVCAYIAAGVEPDIRLVNHWVNFIMTGVAPLPPAHSQQQSGEDDIPF